MKKILSFSYKHKSSGKNWGGGTRGGSLKKKEVIYYLKKREDIINRVLLTKNIS